MNAESRITAEFTQRQPSGPMPDISHYRDDMVVIYCADGKEFTHAGRLPESSTYVPCIPHGETVKHHNFRNYSTTEVIAAIQPIGNNTPYVVAASLRPLTVRDVHNYYKRDHRTRAHAIAACRIVDGADR